MRIAGLIAVALTLMLAAPLVRAQAPVTQPSPVGVTKIACVGDSITYGSRLKDREHDSYPAQLAKMLGDKFNVRNFGVSGTTLLKTGDHPYDKTKPYHAALDFAPDGVVIMLGTNDSKPQNMSHKDDFVVDYKDLIAQFRKANPHGKVYVCLPVPAFPENYHITEEVIREQIIPMVKEVAADTGATLIDLHTALSGAGAHFPDKVHPDPEGARLMADAVYESLTGSPAPSTKPSAR